MSLLAILFPRVRAEVMRLLFADPSRELHLRDIARQGSLSLGTVQQEVEKLGAADLITSRRDGNRRYYRANTRHPVYPDLQQLVLKTSALRDVLVEAIVKIDGIELALVFGSLALGDGKAESDIDLLVIGGAGLRALAPGLRRASRQLHREINPHTYTPAEWSKKRKAGNPFLASVLSGEKLFLKGGPDELTRLG